jgi:hypothetical protein
MTLLPLMLTSAADLMLKQIDHRFGKQIMSNAVRCA